MTSTVQIDLSEAERVTATVYPATPEKRAGIRLILAHGAGTNQSHPVMVRCATGLASRGIDTVTFNFAYSEARRRVPDRTGKLEACYAQVIRAAQAGRFGSAEMPLAIGGRSMGGRIATHLAAQEAADTYGIAALVLLGYPLHPPGQPEKLRAQHLPAIRVPLLFVQGSRDAFGTPDELRPVLRPLKGLAELHVVEGADHSHKVPKKLAPQEAVEAAIFDRIATWLRERVGA